MHSYSLEDRERWAAESAKSPTRTDFERDRARVLHSSALRRLGAKTQVVGPESDDFIRTRLTHSLEVSQIGRSLAKNFGADPDIVETACLCHDIGHPPFGHNGERALNSVAAKIGGFEGNAQTLRVITRLEPKRFHPDGSPAGLNLTRAIVDATAKYPWLRGAGPRGEDDPKFGAYADDSPVLNWAHGDNGWRRCAEAQMMDLSDDIAYSVHDLEDAIVRLALRPQEYAANHAAERAAVIDSTQKWYGEEISASELAAAEKRFFQMRSWPETFTGSLRDLAQIKDLTSDLIGRFVSAVCAASITEKNQTIGRYSADIEIPPDTAAEILYLKGLAVHYVMAPRESEPVFFEQRSLIFDLVDAILEDPLNRLERQFSDLWIQTNTDAERLRIVIDQVASLTDQSARMWHARYCGMLRH